MNNKLIVGGIFCDLEKAFDYVNHSILPAKLKFCGTNGRDLALYIMYVQNRYQVLFNGKQACNIVPSLAKVLHDVPQGCVLGTSLCLLYINDLPKIINDKPIPILFANDTSILVACNNFIDFNNNNILFQMLNGLK
jgi:hypothetical protein